MAVMVPPVSALNETPSSTGPTGPLSIVAGTIELGQMVCCARVLAEQAKAKARPNSTAPACCNNVLDVLVAAYPLAREKIPSVIFLSGDVAIFPTAYLI